MSAKSLSELDYAMKKVSRIYKKFLKCLAEDNTNVTRKQDQDHGDKQKKIFSILHLFNPRIY